VVFARAHRGQNPEDIMAETRLFDQCRTRSAVRHQATLCALELLLPVSE
jgi:nicotinamide-nucleotide amidase